MNAPKIVEDFKAAGGTDMRFCIGPDGVWLPDGVMDYPAEQWAILQAALAAQDPVQQAKDTAIQRIKAATYQYIVKVYPEWKQANITRDATAYLMLGQDIPEPVRQAFVSMSEYIDTARGISTQAEEAVRGQVSAGDVQIVMNQFQEQYGHEIAF